MVRSAKPGSMSDRPGSLSDKDFHTVAQSMWWVSKGADMPDNQKAISALWVDEQAQWLRSAMELLLHLDRNGLRIVPTGEEAAPSS